MAELRVLPPAKKFLKKIKDKHGDLEGVKGYDIYYNKISYELAYTIEYVEGEDGVPKVVVVIMAGTRENFYDELKRYWV